MPRQQGAVRREDPTIELPPPRTTRALFTDDISNARTPTNTSAAHFTVGSNFLSSTLARRPSRSPARGTVSVPTQTIEETTSGLTLEDNPSDVDELENSIPFQHPYPTRARTAPPGSLSLPPTMRPTRTSRRQQRADAAATTGDIHPSRPRTASTSTSASTIPGVPASTASTAHARRRPPVASNRSFPPSSKPALPDPFAPTPAPHLHEDSQPSDESDHEPVFRKRPSAMAYSGLSPAAPSSSGGLSRPGQARGDFISLVPPLILQSQTTAGEVDGDEEAEEGYYDEEDEDARYKQGRAVDRRLLGVALNHWARGAGLEGKGRGRRSSLSRLEREEEIAAEEIMVRLREVVGEKLDGERWRFEGGAAEVEAV